MKLTYAWRLDGLFDADPNAVGDRLSELEATHEFLSKELIIQEGQRRGSPLYTLFEKDPDRALELLHKKQASDIFSSLVLVKNGKKTKKRAFVYVEPNAKQRKAFVSLVVALRQPTLREQIVERGMRDLDRWFDRYSSLAEFKPIRPQLAALRKGIEEELLASV
jgi:hypothetical protein